MKSRKIHTYITYDVYLVNASLPTQSAALGLRSSLIVRIKKPCSKYPSDRITVYAAAIMRIYCQTTTRVS